MSNDSIPILKFQFREDFKALKDSLNIQPGYQVEDFNSANDLATYLSTTNAGLVISSLKTRDDLIQLATFMKVVKKVAKETMVKVVVINFSHDKNFEKAIAKIGIQDVVEPGINTKALKFKLDFWMKSLNVQIKNSPSKDGPKVVKPNDSGKNGEKGKISDQSVPQWTDPLDLENDIWLIKSENDAKKVLSKWLVRLLGPSPYVGQWIEVKGGLWRFDLKDHERDMYLSGDGAWFFSGEQKPEFVWKENVWLISGDTFDLYFRDPNTIQSRLKAKDKALTVSKNSMFAKTKEQMIVESCDKELVFKRESENLSSMEGKNKTDQINGNLQGKSKTDQAGGENLQGKSKTDQINGDPLQGKSKTDQLSGGSLQGKTKSGADKSGNLKGELESSERISNEELDQKTKTGKESSYWNGKNAYKNEEGKADFDVKKDGVREGTLLDMDASNLKIEKNYKNSSEAQKYDPASLKEGGISGKSTTDHLSSHYNNNRSDKETKQTEQKGPVLSGKSETDKLASHYGNKVKTGSEKDKEEKEKADHRGMSEPEKQKSDYSGKSSTDKLSGHYKNAKESSAPETQAKEEATAQELNNKGPSATDNESKDPSSKSTKTSEKESAFNDDDNYFAKKAPNKAQEGKEEDYYSESKKNVNSSGTKKQDADDEFLSKSKTPLVKSFEGNEKYSLNERKVSSKGLTHGQNEQDLKPTKDSPAEVTDNFDELIKKNRPEKVNVAESTADNIDDKVQNEGASIVSLGQARDEKAKAKSPDEARLDEISQDAKVTAVILSQAKKIECSLDDFFEDTIVFSTTDTQLNKNTKVSMNMSFKFLDKETKLNIEGDIQSVEGVEDGTNYVTVSISKDNIEVFNSFMKLYQARQKHITEFLAKAKGVA